MPIALASRTENVRPFEVMRVLAQADALTRAGRDVIHLEVGEPDFGASAAARDAASKALADKALVYTPALGLPDLRERIAQYYERYHGVAVDPECVVVTAGATGALLLLFALLLESGDELLMADPGYPCNRNFTHLVGARAKPVFCSASHGYRMEASQVASAWGPRTRGVLFASPANPTGSMMNDATLRDVAAECRRRNGFLIVDEIYQGLTFPTTASAPLRGHGDTGLDGISSTVLRLDSVAPFVVNSFSKYFGMTGWRLGWLVAPRDCVAAIERMSQNFYIAPNTLAQYAALGALSDAGIAECEQRRAALRERRDFLFGALRQLGFVIPQLPEGAFYIYADVSHLGLDSAEFCSALLADAAVAVTPGHDFTEVAPSKFVRFAYVASLPRLTEAVERIAAFLKRGSSLNA